MALLHFFFAPFASLGYAIALEYWKPFWVATLVAFASVIAAVVITGVLTVLLGSSLSADGATGLGLVVGTPFGYIAPLVSFLMFRSRVLALRARVAGA